MMCFFVPVSYCKFMCVSVIFHRAVRGKMLLTVHHRMVTLSQIDLERPADCKVAMIIT